MLWFGVEPRCPPSSPRAARRGWRPWERRQPHSAPGPELVADGEAFLRGRLVERIESRGERVPAWTWTNLLAHGTMDDLRAEVLPRRRSATAEGQWRQARSFLAGEVLVCAGAYTSLSELQRVVLVPLELSLASTPEAALWKPGRWAIAVERALTRPNPFGPCG